MLITRRDFKEAKKEERRILEENGIKKEFNKLKREAKKLKLKPYLYYDECPEFYRGKFYVLELRDMDKALHYTSVKPNPQSLLKDLEEYINE